MKKNLNIIQIKGVRGLMLAAFVVICLAAGFVVFPGWLLMNVWNITAKYLGTFPVIGLLQGLLLWGIFVVSYFLFRKEKVVVCLKSSEGLSEDELKSVFAEMKKQSIEDPIIQAMMKARETELKIKASETSDTKETENSIESDSTKV